MLKYEDLNTGIGCENDDFTLERYRQFYHFFPKSVKNVLDLGCNTGRGGEVLKDINKSLELTGLDVIKDNIDRLPKDVYKHGICGSATDIPVDDDTFNVVVAGEIIEHLYPKDVYKTLTEAFRVLKIGGRFLVTTPNPRYIQRKFYHKSVLGGSHLSQHFHEILRYELMMVGFSNVRILGSGRVSRYLGYRFPIKSIYGSYLAIATKF